MLSLITVQNSQSKHSVLRACAKVFMALHSHYYNILILRFDTELTRFNSFEMVSSHPAPGVVVWKHKVTHKPIQSAFVSCMHVCEWRCKVKGDFTRSFIRAIFIIVSCKTSTHTHARASHHSLINLMAEYEICMNKFQSLDSHACGANQQNGIYYLCSCT